MKANTRTKQRQAIIWGRFSSDQQKDGDSKDRQDRFNRSCAQSNGIQVIAEYFDSAKSVKDGATPLFKQVVASLPSGVGIICENLDRISRGHPWRAKAYIADILEAGHFIITSQDGREYNSDTIEQLDTLVMGDMASNVARYENNKRTTRVREEKSKAVELARQGKPAPLGAWVPPHLKYNFDTLQYDIQPERLNIIKRIFTEYLKGKGVTSITAGLNLDGIETFRGRRKGKWMKSTIFTLLRYEGLIGVLNYKGERIPKAFPPALNESVFYQVQKMLADNKARHGNYASKRVNNIFRGVCQCSHCGNTMRVTRDNYIACNGYQVKQCKVKNMVKFGELEYEFAKWFVPHAKTALLGSNELVVNIKAVEAKRDTLRAKQQAILDQWDGQTAFAMIQGQLQKLESEMNEASNTIAALKAEQSSNAAVPETLRELDAIIDGVLDNQDTRKRVASLVPSLVKCVKVDIADKYSPSFSAELVNGQTIKWDYIIDEYRQPIKRITKGGKYVLGKGRVTAGHYRSSGK